MKILAIGQASEGFARELFPEDEVFETGRIAKLGLYDAVVSVNVLQTLPYKNIVEALKEWYSHVREGGRIHIVTASLEWAAEAILGRNPIVGMYLYGENGENKSMLKMMDLRALLEQAQIPVIYATTAIGVIEVNGQKFDTERLYVIGAKNESK